MSVPKSSYFPLPNANQPINVRGATIVPEISARNRDSSTVYFPNYIEPISNIAIDIGGSLTKLVFFTRSETIPATPITPSPLHTGSNSGANTPDEAAGFSNNAGSLSPKILSSLEDLNSSLKSSRWKSRVMPGGLLNFVRFQTDEIDDCISFICKLIEESATAHDISIEDMRAGIVMFATGGGAHMFEKRLKEELCVEMRKGEEMKCIVMGLSLLCSIPDEVYSFSDEQISGQKNDSGVFTRPSPDPPRYRLVMNSKPSSLKYPLLLVNIGSGVSIIKVNSPTNFERVSGTSLGGGTLWGLLSLLTPASSFDEMLELADKGDNATVDLFVKDIYGPDHHVAGLDSNVIASSFGKVFRKGRAKIKPSPEDISKSLLYAVSNNIGHVTYLVAQKEQISSVIFSGGFIRGHAATIATLSYAIRFWSKGKIEASFLRHEGYLGAIGAWIMNIPESEG